ncbi:hypothetical protein MNBD_ALPHA04-517 [hydrothermal vent metagenome]|uniref:Uncharacterized protein n=1 Tax=hydrothermal vent metagenome TaxID=652676 RepID=A0A3B0SRN1_9ZZZZ
MTGISKFISIAALLFAPMTVSFWNAPAQASGAAPQYRAYCEAKYRTGALKGVKPRWSYGYNSRTKRMECREADSMGFNTSVKGRTFWINLNELCHYTTGQSDFHWHGEGRVACGRNDHR